MFWISIKNINNYVYLKYPPGPDTLLAAQKPCDHITGMGYAFKAYNFKNVCHLSYRLYKILSPLHFSLFLRI